MKSHNHYALCPECERRIAELEAALRDVLEMRGTIMEDATIENARRALSGAAQPRGEPRPRPTPTPVPGPGTKRHDNQ